MDGGYALSVFKNFKLFKRSPQIDDLRALFIIVIAQRWFRNDLLKCFELILSRGYFVANLELMPPDVGAILNGSEMLPHHGTKRTLRPVGNFQICYIQIIFGIIIALIL